MPSLRDEIGDFVGIPVSFMEDTEQTAESRVVFMVLRYHTNRKRKRAFPGYETIMRESGLSRQKTAAGIKALVSTGWLVKHKQFSRATEYEIRYPSSCVSSTGELTQPATLVPPANAVSSATEQPPLRDNKIEFNKIEKPRQKDSDEAHDAKAPKYSIAEMEHPPPDVMSAIRSEIVGKYPDIPYEKFYVKWWRKAYRLGGVGRKKWEDATVRQYAVSIDGYFETVSEGGIGPSGNGYGNGAGVPDLAKCDPDRPVWMAGQRKQ